MITNVEFNLFYQNLERMRGIEMPQNKVERRVLQKYLEQVNSENPLLIYAGSCPAYSYNPVTALYDFRTIGNSIPLHTQKHAQCDRELLSILEVFNIPYVFIIMIADVEATDQFFADRYTGGDISEFIRRCQASMSASSHVMDDFNLDSGIFRSSSFFDIFGHDRFMDYQGRYITAIQCRINNEPRIRNAIYNDTLNRMDMYDLMYGEYLRKLDMKVRNEFLISRTVRTMAQYLTLGRLIREQGGLPIVVNHPTTNLQLFNGLNKYPLIGEEINFPSIPIFKMRNKIG